MIRYIISISFLFSFLFGFAYNENLNVPNNHFNGAVTESFINNYMRSNGARQINAEVGRNGIDGLFYKKENGKLKVYVIESKYNNSSLGNTKNGKQMSKSWKLSKVDEKINSLKNQLSKTNSKKIEKEIKLLKQVRNIILDGKDRSLLFNIKPLSEEYKELLNKKNLTSKEIKRLEYLKNLKINNRLNYVYKTSLKELDSNGNTIKNASRFGIENKEIDLKKRYSLNTPEYKQQKLLNHSIRKEKRLLKEQIHLQNLQSELKIIPKTSKKYTQIENKIVSQTDKISKIEKSMPKIARKTSIKVGAKAVVKGGIMAGLAFVPIVGQIIDDIYMMYRVEENAENIKKNSNLIKKNQQYIQTLQQEQKILDFKINKNTANINKIFNKLLIYDDQFKQINSQLITITNNISQLYNLVDKNKKEIENIKNGIFVTAIQKMNEYYDSKTNKERYLGDAILMFDFANNIQNPKTKHIVNYYLTILRIEQYKLKNDIHDLGIIENEFNSLIDYAKKDINYLSLVNNTYLILQDINNKEFVNKMQNKLEKITNYVIKKEIDNRLFDNALDIATNYINLINSNKLDNIYQLAYQAKKNNYQKYKNFYNGNILEIINDNQNSLLNIEAIKYFYKHDDFKDAIYILKTKRVDNEFRLKAFIMIYNYLGEKEKVSKLKKLILNSDLYSEKLKNIVKNL